MLVGVHYSQIRRYEEKRVTLFVDIIAKVSNALVVSSNFLMSGCSYDFADNSLTGKELLRQFKAIEKMQDNDKSVAKVLINAFITIKKIQQ